MKPVSLVAIAAALAAASGIDPRVVDMSVPVGKPEPQPNPADNENVRQLRPKQAEKRARRAAHAKKGHHNG